MNHKDRPTNTIKTRVCLCSLTRRRSLGSLRPFTVFCILPLCRCTTERRVALSRQLGVRELASSCLKFKHGSRDDPPPPRTPGQTQSRSVLSFFSVRVSRPTGRLWFSLLHYHSAAYPPHLNLHVYQRLTFSSASASTTSPHQFSSIQPKSLLNYRLEKMWF